MNQNSVNEPATNTEEHGGAPKGGGPDKSKDVAQGDEKEKTECNERRGGPDKSKSV